MKGTASQPHHTSRRETGKRSAQAGRPTDGRRRQGSKPDGRDPARGAGRSPQSPTAARRDAQILTAANRGRFRASTNMVLRRPAEMTLIRPRRGKAHLSDGVIEMRVLRQIARPIGASSRSGTAPLSSAPRSHSDEPPTGAPRCRSPGAIDQSACCAHPRTRLGASAHMRRCRHG